MWVLIALLLLGTRIRRAATVDKPILSLHPPWTTIFKGERVTLRCDGYHPLLLELRPISTLWYLGHQLLPSHKKSIEVQTPGVYRCQTRGAPVSDPIYLSVSNDWLILQVPYAMVFEGEPLVIRCRGWYDKVVYKLHYYKDGHVMRYFQSSANYTISQARASDSGHYQCSGTLRIPVESTPMFSAKVVVTIQELFSSPVLKVVAKSESRSGGGVTLRCETSLHPQKRDTPLQFSFYKYSRPVRRFDWGPEYTVPESETEDLESYWCEAATVTRSVRKRSPWLQLAGKSLAGFARLCPGDQYEIFMKYGRQRWKLKGKIEMNGKQSWDGEEMVFLPLIAGLISIKVTELKGLATHILVGSVTCETKDLFAARPQVVAVDINDLGTIKLNLEITWYPFDVEDVTSSTGNGNRASALQRRMSMYSQGTPETPTFKDHSFFKWLHPSPLKPRRLAVLGALQDTFFAKLQRSRSFSDLPSLRLNPKTVIDLYSNLPDDIFENGMTVEEKRPLSLSFCDLPNGDCASSSKSSGSSTNIGQSNPEITVTPAEHNLSSVASHTSSEDDTGPGSSRNSTAEVQDANLPLEHTEEDQKAPLAASDMCQQAPGPGNDSLFLENDVSVSLLQDSDEVSELKPVELDTFEGNITKQLVKRLTSTEVPVIPERLQFEGSVSGESEGCRSFLDGSLEEAFQGLYLALEPHKEQYKEFQDLNHKVMHLDDVLKCKPAGSRSRPSSLSLTVESALESFDFLNTSDFDEEEEEEEDAEEVCNVGGGPDSVFSDTETEKNSYRSIHPEARGHPSEALTEDTGVGTSVAGSPLPLTTGNESLDITIVRHLQYCTQLIQQIVLSSKTPFIAKNLLEKLSGQIQVMEKLAAVSDENMGNISSVIEAIPEFHKKLSLLSFWTKCCSPLGVYHTSADKVLKQLEINFSRTINKEHPGLAETAFRTLVSRILDRMEPLLSSSLSSEVITVFQYYHYFASNGVSDLEGYLIQLAKQAAMVQTLQSLRDEKLLQNMTDLTANNLPVQQEVFRALAFLLTENNDEISQSVTLYLAAASKNKHFREKALLYYCEALTETNLHLQKAACMALKSLEATESIKMLASLCQSDNEEIRNVASETLLSLGEDGRLAYEQLDQFPRDCVKIGGRYGNEVATAF